MVEYRKTKAFSSKSPRNGMVNADGKVPVVANQIEPLKTLLVDTLVVSAIIVGVGVVGYKIGGQKYGVEGASIGIIGLVVLGFVGLLYKSDSIDPNRYKLDLNKGEI